MIKAVLLDLDNTLIHNPDMAFARAFLERMNAFFLTELGIQQAGQAFRKAIAAMSQTTRIGDQSNIALTAQIMADYGDVAVSAVQDTLNKFYTEVYPTLQNCIKPVEGASAFVHKLHDEGYAIVIATNPIYSKAAIVQRMAWGNLPLDESLYALITNAENMHFSKPDPAYYAEILGRVGVEPDEALMVGDSSKNDINAASQVGIHTYKTDAQNFSEFVTNFDHFVTDVPMSPLNSAMIDPQFRGNIGALYGMLSEVQDHFWEQRPDPDEWSIMQILCHLLDSEDNNERPRLEKILNEDNPFIAEQMPPGPDIPICSDDGWTVAEQVKASRAITRQFIAQLDADDWKRPARHSIFGLTTLLEMAYFTAQHDRLHLNQLCQTLGRCE